MLKNCMTVSNLPVLIKGITPMKTFKCLVWPNVKNKIFTVGKQYKTTLDGKKIIADNGLEYTIYYIKDFLKRFEEIIDLYPTFPW